MRTWRSLKIETGDEDELLAAAIREAKAAGIQAFELKSVSNLTLCIVKADGSIYAGHPTGIVSAGTVFSDQDLTALASRLSAAQQNTYVGQR